MSSSFQPHGGRHYKRLIRLTRIGWFSAVGAVDSGKRLARQTRTVFGRRAVAACVALVMCLGLAACSGGRIVTLKKPSGGAVSSGRFGYMVAGRLLTTNAASAFGMASNSQVLSGRLYPAAFLQGPDGQLIPNSDLITAQEIEQTPVGQRQIRYEISAKATYSDGVPVTCDDFLLAYTAGSMPATFESHQPLFDEVDDLQCASGAKDFNLVLKKDRGERWRYLFGPGTVVPAHAVANKASMTLPDLNAALKTWDPQELLAVAEAWRSGFMLGNFDSAMQVSYGPFVIDHVGDSGQVVLKRNERYYGDPADLDTLVIWPNSADLQSLLSSGELKVADSTDGVPQWLDINREDNPYEIDSQIGELSDTLILADAGAFSTASARQAFAACVDQAALARVSSEQSGMEIPPVYVHSLRHDDPIAKQLDAVTAPHKAVDVKKASALSGTTIRVGYFGPDPRYAAMVDSLHSSCEPAGITIEDANSDSMSAASLQPNPKTGTVAIDAFLTAVDPMTEYATADAKIGEVDALKEEEEALWADVPAIPIAPQPRVFVVDRSLTHVVAFTGLTGIGWNMDRWDIEE